MYSNNSYYSSDDKNNDIPKDDLDFELGKNVQKDHTRYFSPYIIVRVSDH